ncbi:hypothetical protein V1511DRAFT_490034 [Dipodascopsis uninucleata]
MPTRASSLPSISSASSFVHKPFRFWQHRQDDRTSTSAFSSNKLRRWWSPASLKRMPATLFGFNTIPVTVLFVATYVSLLITTYVIQFANPETASAAAVSAAPNSYSAEVESAWYDLQVISENMHPYNSHANDYVHDYIYNRTYEIYHNATPGRIEIDDDFGRLNVTFIQPNIWNASDRSGNLVYFESNNVMVKINGRDPNLSAVLVSAHFDSVPTAYGTTDDGVGIVTMLSMVEYYALANDPPLRTIIFNFNNAEENGLYGAEAFFYHPWSELPSTFYNLEGTGAGGRAVLFRATDYGVADHYSAASMPHANSMLQEGFEHGVIRSETDYRVYEDKGLRGLDVAFYTPRSIYHTEGDSIQGTDRGSVEHMLTASIATVDSMANDPNIDNSSKSKAVFFDLFGSALFVAPVQTFFVVDTVLLVVTPIILFLLLFGLAKSRKLHLGKRGWVRFPVSLIVSTAILFGVLVGLRYANGLIFYNHAGLPFISLASLYFTLNFFFLAGAHRVKPVRHQKFKILLELYFAWWIVMVYANVMENSMRGTGLYWITFNFVGVSFALLLDIISLYFEPAVPMYFVARVEAMNNEHQRFMDDPEDDITHIAPESEHDDDGEESEEEAPLLGEEASDHLGFNRKLEQREDYAWLFEFLILVPFSVFLTSQIGFLALAAVRQTLQEGGSSLYNVYLSVFVFVIILMYPIMPFIHKVHFVIPFLLLLTFSGTFLASCFLFPFSSEDPLKVTFIQQIELGDNDTIASDAFVTVTGLDPYVMNVVYDLPSVSDFYCTKHSGVPYFVEKCMYAGLYPNVTYGYPYDWLNVTAYNGTNETVSYTTTTSAATATSILDLPTGSSESTMLNRFVSAKVERSMSILADGEDNTPTAYNATITIYANNSRTCVMMFEPPFDHRIPRILYGGEDAVKDFFENFNSSDDKSASSGEYTVTSASVSTNYTNYTYPEPIYFEDGIKKITMFKLDWYSPFIVSLMYTKNEDVESDTESGYLPVYVGCQWAEWSNGEIPALDELDEYSPRWVAVTKAGTGLVEVWKTLYLNDTEFYYEDDDIIDEFE